MTGFWYNKKNGKRYLVFGTVRDSTNIRDGDLAVLYMRFSWGNGPWFFVRDLDEFTEKFRDWRLP